MENNGRKRTMNPSQVRITLTAVVALAVLLFSTAYSGEINKAVKETEKKASQTGDIESKPVGKEVKGSAVKAPTKPKPPAVSPAQIAPAEIEPADRQIEPLSASATDEKGRVIKWQIICTGSGCGNDDVVFSTGYQGVHYLCGTLGQVAVGRGSSPSFGLNQGFWQETITEEYVRGDVNRDDIINVGDIVYLVSYLYKNGPAPNPVWVGDCNCDEIVNIGDIVFLVSYLYKGGPEPSC
jgi:hypothetical protein